MTPTTPSSTAPETLRFQAEVTQVLDLVIHSLYSHKEVFLRELVSNASDAIDKLRFEALTRPELLADGAGTPEIRLIPDGEAGTLTIEDDGIGMTREELATNLGTIAHSGSRRLLEELRRRAADGGKAPDLTLIGQFGVGFYSAFLVADRVEVISRPASGGPAHRWVSEAKETFTLEEATDGAPPRGTRVVLHLKKDERRFTDEWELRELVRRYSDYVSHPIQLRVGPKQADAVPKYERVNRAAALWQRPKSDITDAEYDELYKHLAHDLEPPLARTHFRVEGTHEFVGLLYIPKKPPFDLQLPPSEHRGVRLFVKRVFVMDRADELVPEYLRFLRGVVDSDDLPLNVSREVLQDRGASGAVARAIKKQVTKKTLDLLEELAKDRPADYALFWRAFGPILKGGLHLDREHKDRLAKLFRAATTVEPEGLVSLDAYVARMKEGQDAIYYAVGDDRAQLLTSPHTEALRARGVEVLLLGDPVDEIAMEAIGEYGGKKLVSVMRAETRTGAGDKDAATPDIPSALQPLAARIRAILQEHVSEVRASDRLTESPVCLVVPPGGLHASVERMLKQWGQKVPTQRRILEINPTHPLIERLGQLAADAPTSPTLTDAVEILYAQALLTEGSPLPDANGFARRLTALLTSSVAMPAKS
jgi:molecular chaperone HtpG